MIALVVLGCGDPAAPKQRLRLEKTSPDSVSFDFGTTPTYSPSVRVVDSNGKPVAGVTVLARAPLDEVYTNLISDSNGVAAVEWKPKYAQNNYLTMYAVNSDTVHFLATGRCVAKQSISLGLPVSGTLSAGDCESLFFCNSLNCYFQLEDRVTFETASALLVKMQATSSGYAWTSVKLFDTESRVLGGSFYAQSISAYRPFWVIIPPGSYEITVSTNSPPESYELAIDGPVSDPGCELLFIVRGSTTSQGLDSLDCADQSRYIDSFEVFVGFEQTVTVSLESSAFASELTLQHTNYFPGGVLVPAQRITGSPGVPAQLSASCSVAAPCTFRITASSSTTLTTGAYTLSVQ